MAADHQTSNNNAAAAAPRGPWPSFGSLEWRLFVVVFVGLLPLALLGFFTLWRNAEDQRAQLLESAQATMRAVISAVDAEHARSIASLDALAGSSRLAADDLTAFRQEAQELLERRPDWANIVLTTPQAQQLMNVRLPPGEPLPRRVDAATVERTVDLARPVVGDMLFSPVLRKQLFGVQVPIMRKGQVVYVLVAVIQPDAVRRLLERQRAPAQGVVAVADGHHNLVARSLHHDSLVGKPVSPGLLALLEKGQADGWARTVTLEGRPVYSVFQRSALTGWVAAVGIPVEAIDGSVLQSYAMLGGSIVLSMVLGLLAAWWIGRTITGPMEQLRQAAGAMAEGKPPVLPQTTLPALRDVGEALAAAYVERETLLNSEREARLRAESASRAKDEFLAMLGHELRNPLAAVSNASLILDKLAETPNARPAGDARAIIRRQVRRLARLTDDLLDAGRLMVGKIVLEHQPVDLAAAVRHTVASLKQSGALDGHDPLLALAPVWVAGDAVRLEQLVGNLLGNAAKYTPASGAIQVTLRREGNEALLSVRDTGIGIESELLPAVFELFVQGRRSLDRAQGGLGIGLTLVRRIAELHGGRVQAFSDGEARGSEFLVHLPAIEPPAEASALDPGRAPGASLRIALVEDNADVRETLRALLESDGHRVLEAGDGPSGVELILRERPDVAIVDVGLPRLDGYGVARAVRAEVGAAVRIIAMTGYGAEDDRQRGREAGVDAYLVKPVDPAVLASVLSRA